MDAFRLFEAELRRRGVPFRPARDAGRYELSVSTGPLLVSLDNLSRELRGDHEDIARVAHFIDVVIASGSPRAVAPARLLWALEPSNLAERAPYHVEVSPRVHRASSDYAADASSLRWLTRQDLGEAALSDQEAFERAWSNLDVAVRDARVHLETVEGATAVWLETDFPSKASLIVAPCLREIVSPYIGWPVLAVTPDRGFVYLWGADRRELIPRFGPVIVREYRNASHPLTTEVFEIDEAVTAIGAFPTWPGDADRIG